MRQALDEERKNRDQLEGELSRTRALVNEQSQQIQNVRGQLETKEQLAARLAEAQTNLQREFTAAQTNLCKFE